MQVQVITTGGVTKIFAMNYRKQACEDVRYLNVVTTAFANVYRTIASTSSSGYRPAFLQAQRKIVPAIVR